MVNITNSLLPLSHNPALVGSGGRLLPAGQAANNQVQTEFMTIFYKEMLKQVFTTPKFGADDDEESGFNSSITALNADLLAEKMAEHMVKNALASSQWADLAGQAVSK